MNNGPEYTSTLLVVMSNSAAFWLHAAFIDESVETKNTERDVKRLFSFVFRHQFAIML